MCRLKLIVKQSQSQRARKSNERQIFASYAHNSERVLFFTGLNIFLKYWDKKNQCVKRACPSSYKQNMYLLKFRQKLDDIICSALAEDINPTTSYVKDIYHGRKLKDVKKKSKSFWAFADEYVDNAKVRLSPATIKSYKTAMSNLKLFERYSRTKIDFHNIDLQFYHDYMDYYIGFRSLKISGFGKVIKFLKIILNSATEQGYNENMTFKSNSFKVVTEEADNIYLTEDELQKIIELDLSNNKKLVRVRDLFYLGCYTGLRFSDYNQICKENIIAKCLHVKTKKTGKAVVVPLADEALKVIEKYDGNLPKPMANQVMNRYLKEIGQLAEIDDDFNKYHTTGKGRVKETFKKWELICTHTARRSYATNMYKRGFESSMIMAVTGHTSEKVFLNYIKISNEENAQRMLRLMEQSKNGIVDQSQKDMAQQIDSDVPSENQAA